MWGLGKKKREFSASWKKPETTLPSACHRNRNPYCTPAWCCSSIVSVFVSFHFSSLHKFSRGHSEEFIFRMPVATSSSDSGECLVRMRGAAWARAWMDCSSPHPGHALLLISWLLMWPNELTNESTKTPALQSGSVTSGKIKVHDSKRLSRSKQKI